MPNNECGPEVCFYFADLTAGPDGWIALMRISPISRSSTAVRRKRKNAAYRKTRSSMRKVFEYQLSPVSGRP